MNIDLITEKTIFPICLKSDIEDEEFLKETRLQIFSEEDKKKLFGMEIQEGKICIIDNEKYIKIGYFFRSDFKNITHALISRSTYDSYFFLSVSFALRILFSGNSGFRKYIDKGHPLKCGHSCRTSWDLLKPTEFNKKNIQQFHEILNKIYKLTFNDINELNNPDCIYHILERFYYATSGENILLEDRFNNLVSILEKILVKDNEPKAKAIAIRVSKILKDVTLEKYLTRTIYGIRSSITHNLTSNRVNSSMFGITKLKSESNSDVLLLEYYPNSKELLKLIEIVRKIILYYIENIDSFDLDKIALIPTKTLICQKCNSTDIQTIWQ